MGARGIRPLVGLSFRHPGRPDAMLARLVLALNGARVRVLRPGSPVPWEALNGLVVGGGHHVHPRHFGQDAAVRAHYRPHRDRLELELLAFARRRHLPVLGLCRGAQVLNVSRGGVLVQDIVPLREFTEPGRLLLPLQGAQVQPGSRLARLLTRTRLGINRIHSQAMESLGSGLRPVAWDADGFIQAIECTEGAWQVGVQWHPEYLLYHPLHRRLFAGLVRAARRWRNQTHKPGRTVGEPATGEDGGTA
jgi:putative glutamine amidotransferase